MDREIVLFLALQYPNNTFPLLILNQGNYRDIILPYIQKAFDLTAVIKESKEGNFIRVNIYSKSLFELLTFDCSFQCQFLF